MIYYLYVTTDTRQELWSLNEHSLFLNQIQKLKSMFKSTEK
jgi:hypothetical protein